MLPTRLEQLKQFTKEEPTDPFNWYALALEESKGNPIRGLELFDTVLETHPYYLASYYQAAMLSFSVGNFEKGKEILIAGIALAQQQGQEKTLRELKALLNEYSDESI